MSLSTALRMNFLLPVCLQTATIFKVLDTKQALQLKLTGTHQCHEYYKQAVKSQIVKS
jgi:hypothetical protein